MAEPVGIKVEGLNEFRRELKKLEENLTPELKQINYELATQVTSWAQTKAAAVSPQASKAAKEGLKASRTAARAQVILGSNRAPYALGAEFGALRWKQFQRWRGNATGAGYFLWPSIRDHREEIMDIYGEALDKLASKAFPD